MARRRKKVQARGRLVREILRATDRWKERTLLAMTPEELRAVHEELHTEEVEPPSVEGED